MTGPADRDSWSVDGHERLTETLSTVFAEQADRFEPSNDAYARLAAAVTEEQRPSRVAVLARPLIAAAAVAAIAGVGAVLVARQDTQSVGTGPGQDEAASVADGQADATTPAADAEAAITASTTTPPASTSESTEAAEAAVDAVEDPRITGPVRPTEIEAAQAFLDLLRLPYGTPEIVDGDVVVRSYAEGGVQSEDGRIAASLSVIEVDGGYAVVEATTDLVVIDSVDDGALAGSTLAVAGMGTGFESEVTVRVVSAVDNRVLASGYTGAGGTAELLPFSAEIEVTGAERAWVVVASGGGADGVIDPFAARPVSYVAAADPTDHGVVRIRPDDPDGGLRLRSGPGVDNDSIGVIPTGTFGIRRNPEYPVAVGDDVWWSITTAAGQSGWVNSRFVASMEAVSDQELRDVAARLGAGPGGYFDPALVDPTRRTGVAVGTLDHPIEIPATELLTRVGWDENRSYPAPEDYGVPFEASLADFVHLEAWPEAALEPRGGYSYEPDRAAAEAYFGALPWIVVSPPNPNEPWDRTFVFVEKTETGIDIVGLVMEVQRP